MTSANNSCNMEDFFNFNPELFSERLEPKANPTTTEPNQVEEDNIFAFLADPMHLEPVFVDLPMFSNVQPLSPVDVITVFPAIQPVPAVAPSFANPPTMSPLAALLTPWLSSEESPLWTVLDPVQPTPASAPPHIPVTISISDLQILVAEAVKNNQPKENPECDESTSQDRPYMCPIPGCEKRFNRAFNMRTHVETHKKNRPRPFVCNEPGCFRTFVRVHDLRRHSASHDVSRWHTCTICGRSYARIDAYRRHKASVCKD